MLDLVAIENTENKKVSCSQCESYECFACLNVSAKIIDFTPEESIQFP